MVKWLESTFLFGMLSLGSSGYFRVVELLKSTFSFRVLSLGSSGYYLRLGPVAKIDVFFSTCFPTLFYVNLTVGFAVVELTNNMYLSD